LRIKKIQKMKNVLFIFIIALLFSCGGDMGGGNAGGSNSIDGEIVPGFTYVNHTKKGGKTPQLTEYAYFNYYVMDGDSMMFNNLSTGKPQKVVMSDDFSGRLAGQKPLILALQKMSIGDSLSLYIPRDSLPPNNNLKSDKLTYHISLVDIKDEAAFLKDAEAEAAIRKEEMAANQARESEIAEMVALRAKEYKKGALDSKIKTTESGLKYIIHEEGSGEQPKPGQEVFANYFGALTDGTPFDNSFKRGQLFNFPIGQGRVIRGWDEGFALLKPGAKATLFIPAELGYGATGSPPTIPGGAELIFYVEFDSAR
jgi:FKBP-type peptidyl-prolyl cis-trans isomerase FkpA